MTYLEQSIDKARLNKRILFCVPESAGDIFLSTSLLESIKENHPNFDIYFACKPQFKLLLKNNPFIFKILDYCEIMENFVYMEGSLDWDGLFDISYFPTLLTQRTGGYTHNGLDKIAFNLKK
jgi:hypothetical protein